VYGYIGCQQVCKCCDDGFYLDSKYKCQPLPCHCEAANSDGTCKCCEKGFYLDCDKKCQPLPCHCTDANPDGSCKCCENGYTV